MTKGILAMETEPFLPRLATYKNFVALKLCCFSLYQYVMPTLL